MRCCERGRGEEEESKRRGMRRAAAAVLHWRGKMANLLHDDDCCQITNAVYSVNVITTLIRQLGNMMFHFTFATNSHFRSFADKVVNMPEGQLCFGFMATPGGESPILMILHLILMQCSCLLWGTPSPQVVLLSYVKTRAYPY